MMSFAIVLLLQLDEAIRDLAAENAAVRDAATRRLEAAGRKGIPHLREACESGDPERAARAKAVLYRLVGDPPTAERERAASAALMERAFSQRITVDFKESTLRESVMQIGNALSVPSHVYSESADLERMAVSLRELKGDTMLRLVLEGTDHRPYTYHGVIIVTRRIERCDWYDALPVPGPTLDAMNAADLSVEARETVQVLGRVLDVDMDRAAPADAFEWFAAHAECDLHARGEFDSPITARLSSVPAHVALRLICLEAGADWHIEPDGSIHIVKRR